MRKWRNLPSYFGHHRDSVEMGYVSDTRPRRGRWTYKKTTSVRRFSTSDLKFLVVQFTFVVESSWTCNTEKCKEEDSHLFKDSFLLYDPFDLRLLKRHDLLFLKYKDSCQYLVLGLRVYWKEVQFKNNTSGEIKRF